LAASAVAFSGRLSGDFGPLGLVEGVEGDVADWFRKPLADLNENLALDLKVEVNGVREAAAKAWHDCVTRGEPSLDIWTWEVKGVRAGEYLRRGDWGLEDFALGAWDLGCGLRLNLEGDRDSDRRSPRTADERLTW
jgi:hypothetical protein